MFFSFSILKAFLHFLLAFIVSGEKSAMLHTSHLCNFSFPLLFFSLNIVSLVLKSYLLRLLCSC